MACTVVAVFATIGIIASLLVESICFFALVPIDGILFEPNREPKVPIREDRGAAEGAFGWIPVLTGTLLVMALRCFRRFRWACFRQSI